MPWIPLQVSHSPICCNCDILGLIKRLDLTMPKKIRELKQMLVRANFTEIPGKGSHTNWIHPLYAGKLTVSGKDSSDAKRYQEKDVQQAIQEVEEKQRDNQEDEQI
jgi:predicted RNA binding protein YcfA (HicA-like mRNA interferase family)